MHTRRTRVSDYATWLAASTTGPHWTSTGRRYHGAADVERSSHAVYGLVIITATLVADRVHATDALVSLLALWGATLVLVLAHTYSALIAELSRRGHRLTYAERHVLIADNIPLATSVVVPSVLLAAAGVGILDPARVVARPQSRSCR